jgi:hypothetical protein
MDIATEAKLISRIKDFPWFAENFLKVKPKGENEEEDEKNEVFKESSVGLVPFKLNQAQLYLHRRLEDQLAATGKVRAVILKGRQQGCSTYTQARYFHKLITSVGKKAFVLAHQDKASDGIFKMTRRFYENLEDGLCPKPSKLNTSEMEFSAFNSEYRVGTAGNKHTGRSETIHLFHGSEVALWENTNEISTGIMQSIPNSRGSEIILESTAQKIGNYFHKCWLAAEGGISDYQAIFIPWYWQKEYRSFAPGFVLTNEENELLSRYSSNGLTVEHLAWRRSKIIDFSPSDLERGEENFKQEYPFTAAEAFLNSISNTFIKQRWVNKARSTIVDTKVGLIIGVDPAGDKDGADRTAIIRRRGRKAYKLQTFRNHNTMQICGILVNIIKEEMPVKIYVDCIGIGKGIVDRMRELGYDFVEGINVGLQAHDKERFANRRAELWSLCADWLMQDMGVELPADSDELQTDLCGCGYEYRSNGQLLIEDKDSLKKRGLPSPDCADALVHTFCGGFYEAANSIDPMANQIPQHRTRGMFV